MAQFEKGRKKTGGRKKGVPNHSNFSRERIISFVDNDFETFIAKMNELANEDAKAYVGVYVKMLQYVVPTLQSTHMESSIETKSEILEQILHLMQPTT